MRILFLESIHGRHNELKYASCVAKEYAEELRRKGHEVKEVLMPTPEKANKIIKEFNPDIIWFVGHGYSDRATLEKLQLWIKDDMPLDQLKGRIVVAHSCLTGIKLGKVAVQKGAKAYFGFTSEMYFHWCGPDFDCACVGKNNYGVRPIIWVELVKDVHRPPLEFLKAVAEGKTPKEAFEHSLKVAEDLIRKVENIEPASSAEASVLKITEWILKSNRTNQVLYVGRLTAGGEGSKGTPERQVETLSTKSTKKAILFGFVLPFVIITAVAGWSEHAGSKI